MTRFVVRKAGKLVLKVRAPPEVVITRLGDRPKTYTNGVNNIPDNPRYLRVTVSAGSTAAIDTQDASLVVFATNTVTSESVPEYRSHGSPYSIDPPDAEGKGGFVQLFFPDNKDNICLKLFGRGGYFFGQQTCTLLSPPYLPGAYSFVLLGTSADIDIQLRDVSRRSLWRLS